jgi:hypothetical protein
MKKIILHLILLTAASAAPVRLQAWSCPSWSTQAVQSDECQDCAECAHALEIYALAHPGKVQKTEQKSKTPKKTLFHEMSRLAGKVAMYADLGAQAVSHTVLSVPGVQPAAQKVGQVTEAIKEKLDAMRDRYPHLIATVVFGALAGWFGGHVLHINSDLPSKQWLQATTKGACIGTAVNLAYNIALNSTYRIPESDLLSERHVLASCLISAAAAAAILAKA